ncbi:MAG TPA: transglutaminase family protein, partial [Kineosporiaceae bacterium]|nr:transglutaminase family protein [Kineosporiaceae bacterium]
MSGRRYRVSHRTVYSYDDEVTASYGRAYLTPRDVPGQWTRDTRIEVSPTPGLLTPSEDFFGNTSVYVEVLVPHTRLTVTAISEVEVDRPIPSLASIDGWTWEAARDGSPVDPVQACQFLLPSPRAAFSNEVREYAGRIFPPGRAVGSAVRDLIRAIHADFAYKPGVTSVSTPLTEVLERREGVCQDFAHLAVACLRGVGLPARYVSGYLETLPPPGRPRLQGADASHAWASVLLPELGWVDIDPTNDRVVDDDYVITAWGRDYSDVPPLRGVIFTE